MLARRASRLSSIEATKGMILAMKKNIWRAAIEVGFIIFLFYSNLLMGDLSVQVWEGGGRSVGNRRCFHYCKFRIAARAARWLCRFRISSEEILGKALSDP